MLTTTKCRMQRSPVLWPYFRHPHHMGCICWRTRTRHQQRAPRRLVFARTTSKKHLGRTDAHDMIKSQYRTSVSAYTAHTHTRHSHFHRGLRHALLDVYIMPSTRTYVSHACEPHPMFAPTCARRHIQRTRVYTLRSRECRSVSTRIIHAQR